MFPLMCNGCGRSLEERDRPAGGGVTCPHCGQVTQAPAGRNAGLAPTTAAVPEGLAAPTVKFVPVTSFPPARGDSAASPVPGYEVLGQLGRGGMGVVYKARHLALNRVVALKMILSAEHAGEQERARFQAEAEAVAHLRHPNIVQIFDCGVIDDKPYLALEYCAGGSLAARLRGAPLQPPEAARVVGQLTQAVAAAHVAGIVHRDLKPANVLLQVADGQGPGEGQGAPTGNLDAAVPKITDFGLAKRLDDDSGYTRTGAILGTPSYMAPEQALGEAKRVGPAADIYALGAILYELLTGRPPFRGASVLETLEQVRTQEPVPPRVLQPKTPRDLETICLKCLHKDGRKRYASATELADDLRRYQDGEPIRARPVGALERTAKWARRHKGAVAALSGLCMFLVVLAAGSLVAAAYYSALAEDRDTERGKAVEAGNRAEAARKREAQLGQDLRVNLYNAEMNLAGQAAGSPGGIGQVAGFVSKWRHTQPDLRGWEWYYLRGLCQRELLTLRGHRGEVRSVAWSPDGKRLASAGSHATIKIWDPASGRELRTLQETSAACAVAWGPDGTQLLSGTCNGAVTVWDAASGKQVLACAGHPQPVWCVAWSPDGRRLASGSGDLTVKVWDTATGKQTLTLGGHTDWGCTFVVWSPDSTRLATDWGKPTGHEHKIAAKIWDAASGKEILSFGGHGNYVGSLAWSPDGRWLASGSLDETIKVWNAASGKEMLTLRGHTSGVVALAWNPDSKWLASASSDQTVKLWDTVTGKEATTFQGHANQIDGLAWSPDGTRLASGSFDQTVKIWDPFGRSDALRGHPGYVASVAWNADGSRLASAGYLSDVKVWDTASGREVLTSYVHRLGVTSAAWSPDGKRLASSSFDRTIKIWDAATEIWDPAKVARVLSPGESSPAWSPDGTRLAGAVDQTVKVWDIASGSEIYTLRGHVSGVTWVGWNPNGMTLASTSYDGTVRLWGAADGKEIRTLRGHTSGNVATGAWNRTGTRLATGGGLDRTIRIWDVASGKEILTLRGHTGGVTSLAWTRDDTRLASASSDGIVKLWDIALGKEVLTLRGPGHHVTSVAWSPDATRLACAGADGTILIRDATLGFVVERSPHLLPVLDRRLAAEPTAEDLQMRADIHARLGNWDKAAADARQYLALLKDAPATRIFPSGWWIIGPFPANLKDSYPHEQNPDPRQPVAVTASSNDEAPTLLHWQTVPRDANGLVNFGELFQGTDPFSAYALLRVYSLDKQPVKVLVGSSGPICLWLNNKEIHEKAIGGPAAPAQEAVPVTLEAGWNTLLARVVARKDQDTLYLRLSGEPVQRASTRIELLERRLEKQKGKLGPDHPDTLFAMNTLAQAYEEAGRHDRAESLLRALLARARKQHGPKSVEAAGAMVVLSLNLLRQEKYAEAEPVLRECLAIRQKEMPNSWRTFNARSLLGGALLGQKKYAEAEPLLLTGYEGIKRREATIAPHQRHRVVEALERLVQLYEATGQKDKAEAWRKKLEAVKK